MNVAMSRKWQRHCIAQRWYGCDRTWGESTKQHEHSKQKWEVNWNKVACSLARSIDRSIDPSSPWTESNPLALDSSPPPLWVTTACCGAREEDHQKKGWWDQPFRLQKRLVLEQVPFLINFVSVWLKGEGGGGEEPEARVAINTDWQRVGGTSDEGHA